MNACGNNINLFTEQISVLAHETYVCFNSFLPRSGLKAETTDNIELSQTVYNDFKKVID